MKEQQKKTYNGNPLLLRSGAKIQWTKEMIVELGKCKDDPVYFAKTYFKIVNVDDGLMPFDLYDFQEEAIRASFTHRNILLNSSRQAGKTSIITAILLHYALFNKNKIIGILANKQATSHEVLRRVKLAYEYLPDFLKGGVSEWNKGSVEFENGSIILAAASSASSIRGKTLNMLLIDEVAFVPNWAEFSKSTLPTISSGKTTKMIFLSTPSGLNHFYKYCTDAQKKKNNFYYIEAPWWKVPGRDQVWADAMLAELNGDKQAFEQEYCCKFHGGQNSLISGDALRAMAVSDVVDQTAEGLKIYEEVNEENKYIISADVGSGTGGDFSAFSVIDISQMPYRQVAAFRNNVMFPHEYADEIYKAATYYNKAFVLVENIDIGMSVCDRLTQEYEYENLFYTQNQGQKGIQLVSGFGGKLSGKNPGVRTNKKIKRIGCIQFKNLVENQKLVIQDAETIHEVGQFIRVGDSYEADQGKKDDLVMGLVLFSWLVSQDAFADYSELASEANKPSKIQDFTSQAGLFGKSKTHNEQTVYDVWGRPVIHSGWGMTPRIVDPAVDKEWAGLI